MKNDHTSFFPINEDPVDPTRNDTQDNLANGTLRTIEETNLENNY